MQFQVPQFIEVEDKIFGPLTIRQFIYLAGGIGLSALAYLSLPFFVAIFIIIPIGALSMALAFWKINNKPFIDMLEAAVMYTVNTKLYIWKKGEKKSEAQKQSEEDIFAPLLAPKLSDSKLKDLAWSLDVSDSASKRSNSGGMR